MRKHLILLGFLAALLFANSSPCRAAQDYFEDTVWVKKVPNFGSIDDVKFSKNDSIIVAHGYGTNIFFETKNGNEITRILSYAPIQFFNNDENFVQIATSNDRLEIYQTSNFKAIDTLEYKTDSICSILVSNDENYAIGVIKNGFCVWDLKTKKIIKTVILPEEEYLRSIEITIQNLCDNKTFLASFFKTYTRSYPPYNDYLIVSYNTYNYSDLDSIDSKEGTGFCRISNNCEILAKNIRDSNYGVELLNFKTGELIQKLPIDGNSLTGMEFSPDDKYIVTSNGPDGNSLIVWNSETGEKAYIYPYGSYSNIDVSNNGKYIIASCGEYLFLINFKNETSIVENKDENNVKTIYPNPATGNVTIDFNIISTRKNSDWLIDLKGELIKSVFNGFLRIW